MSFAKRQRFRNEENNSFKVRRRKERYIDAPNLDDLSIERTIRTKEEEKEEEEYLHYIHFMWWTLVTNVILQHLEHTTYEIFRCVLRTYFAVSIPDCHSKSILKYLKHIFNVRRIENGKNVCLIGLIQFKNGVAIISKHQISLLKIEKNTK